mgnify:CR=1 FL=1
MITIWHNNTTPCVIRPTPLISISQSVLKNKIGKFGATYDITLNGAIIAHGGSPFYLTQGSEDGGQEGDLTGPKGGIDGGGFTGRTSVRPTDESVAFAKRLDSILSKQNAIRQLFAQDGQKMEIMPIDGSTPRIICYPSVESITFDEGVYVDICRFTINLTANTLLDGAGNVLQEGAMDSSGTESAIVAAEGGFIEDFNDTWSVEVDESFGQTGGGAVNPRAYRVTRNISATGRTTYIHNDPSSDPSANDVVRRDAFLNAQDYVKKRVSSDSLSNYPNNLFIGSGFLDLDKSAYNGYNHIRTENIDKGAGSYSITDTYLVASGADALENYNASVQTSTDNAFVSVSIDGTIKGIVTTPASGYGTDQPLPYEKARNKYLTISNQGNFGVGSQIYKRANALTNQELNSQPNSVSLGSNEFTGEITYNLSFNNRPVNVFTGVVSETINVNDTYPGDVYAAIPILGRTTGPILQYIGGRTEYRRDVSIEMVLDSTDIGYGDDRTNLLLRKPSINEPIRTELKSLIQEVSPANEPGIRKYFLAAPTESWNPKTGNYSLNLSWTYELDS